ncbi:ferritin-like domain-containing protein [Streptomyces sp. AJS327]|uniref:ferritin-like domain-containing protein n=1 Tax=Streptomyces sp. AJS327 TaxID=2545265 RepID=UPI0015DEB73C|nr:ferritin-like domain-containing protein [Streptomyces sp. AJS327]MBA0052705.1 ferritin-like domain-containing protein [Streptomyces sp. AJS327]
MHAFDVFNHYERNHWKLSDIDFDSVDRSLVEPEYVTLAKSAVMGECNSIAATHGFFNEFVDDYDFSAFAAIWGYQELQHHYAFKSWLRAIDEDVDQRPVDAMRAPYAPGSTPSATLATNIISELTVNHVYRAVAEWVREPVLRDLLRRASRDEAGHAREFIHYTKTRLERLPEELPSVLETLYVYTSEAKIKHPVSLFKDSLVEGDFETIDTGFEFFLEKVASEGELEQLHAKVRGAFGSMTGLDLTSGARIRRALAGALS